MDRAVSDDLPAVARRYALQNALQHGEADPKSCMGRIMGAHPEFRARAGDVMPALQAACAEVNAMSPDEQREALEADAPELLETKKRERSTGLKPLPNAEKGKVVLRFAPNPNGPLSLGHARGVAIMSQYADEWDGEVVLRFDDTDPQVKPPLYDPEHGVDAYAMIAEDWEWLAGRPADCIVKASDRIDFYHEQARALIERDGAYVCTCDAEAWRDMKNQGHPCPHRDIPAADHLDAFTKMVDGAYGQGEAVLRVKTDIQHKDPALRDWTAFRIVRDDAIHPREATGEIDHHTCWPLLDFESAVEDHAQGVTHIIRGKDLMDSTRKQAFLYEHMGWDYPETMYWGRVSVHEFGKFSTSAIRQGIADGTYEGWDDPRLPTLRALQRRGYTASAVKAFWIGLGLTEKDMAISLQNMDAEDGKAIDDAASRFFFVPDPHEVTVSGMGGRIAKPLVHPSHEDRGTRTIAATDRIVIPGDEADAPSVRLKDLGNIVMAGGTSFFAGEEMDRRLPIIQWLPHDAPAFAVLKPEFLTDDSPDDAEPTLREVVGQIEPAALEHVGSVVQFERFGFVKLETAERGVWLHA